MREELDQALTEYQAKWQKLVDARQNKEFFTALRATAVGWKVADLDEFDKTVAELRAGADFVHAVWMNERWLAEIGLRDALSGGVCVVKLMQRRPDSSDALGLDHVDFLSPNFSEAKQVLGAENGLKWSEEKNGDHCQWISVWFEGTEAKVRSDMALDAAIGDIEDFKKRIAKNIV